MSEYHDDEPGRLEPVLTFDESYDRQINAWRHRDPSLLIAAVVCFVLAMACFAMVR